MNNTGWAISRAPKKYVKCGEKNCKKSRIKNSFLVFCIACIVFSSSLIRLGLSKIACIIIQIVLNVLVRDLWPTLYILVVRWETKISSRHRIKSALLAQAACETG